MFPWKFYSRHVDGWIVDMAAGGAATPISMQYNSPELRREGGTNGVASAAGGYTPGGEYRLFVEEVRPPGVAPPKLIRNLQVTVEEHAVTLFAERAAGICSLSNYPGSQCKPLKLNTVNPTADEGTQTNPRLFLTGFG